MPYYQYYAVITGEEQLQDIKLLQSEESAEGPRLSWELQVLQCNN